MSNFVIATEIIILLLSYSYLAFLLVLPSKNSISFKGIKMWSFKNFTKADWVLAVEFWFYFSSISMSLRSNIMKFLLMAS